MSQQELRVTVIVYAMLRMPSSAELKTQKYLHVQIHRGTICLVYKRINRRCCKHQRRQTISNREVTQRWTRSNTYKCASTGQCEVYQWSISLKKLSEKHKMASNHTHHWQNH